MELKVEVKNNDEIVVIIVFRRYVGDWCKFKVSLVNVGRFCFKEKNKDDDKKFRIIKIFS